jgi:hypothetical protein
MASKYNNLDVVEYRDKDGSIKLGQIMGYNEHGYLIQPASIVPKPLAYSLEEIGKVVNLDGSTKYSENDYVIFRDKDGIMKHGQIIGYNGIHYIIKDGPERPGKEYSVDVISHVTTADGSHINRASKYAQGVYVEYIDKNDHRAKIGQMLRKEGDQYIIQAQTIIPPVLVYSPDKLIQVVTPYAPAPPAPPAPTASASTASTAPPASDATAPDATAPDATAPTAPDVLVAPEGADYLDEIETELYGLLLSPFQSKVGEIKQKPGVKLSKKKIEKIRGISLELLETFKDITLDLCKEDSDFKPVTIIPARTGLLRTYAEGDTVLKEGIVFCNSMPLSNVQIRNPKTVNDSVAIIQTTRELKLFNFILISMLFGAQIKEGNSKRGIFADCCELAVIRMFCEKHKYDGVILTDQADMYLFNDDQYLPKELHLGTECRAKMNARAIDDLVNKRSFLAFGTNGIGVGAIYPEFVIFNNGSLEVKSTYKMEKTYVLDKFLAINSVPDLIPKSDGDWVVIEEGVLRPSQDIYARQKKIGEGLNSKIRVLPYYDSRDFSVRQAHDLALDFIKLYIEPELEDSKGAKGASAEGGKKTKKSKKSKTKKYKKSKTKKSKKN